MWAREQDEELRELWTSGVSIRLISTRLHCSYSQVCNKARALNLPGRYQRHIIGSPNDSLYLNQEANKRNISVRSLRNKVLHTAIRARLIDAILDDGA